MTTITNTQNLIDSRDIIERIEELSAWINSISEDDPMRSVKLNSPDAIELAELEALAKQAESSPDWIHGETLIRRSYFEQYIADLIDECYDLPANLKSGEWPYRHIKIDIEAAAKEAEQDYLEVDFGDVEYLIRA